MTRCAGCGSSGASPCGDCVDRMEAVGAVSFAGLDAGFALVSYDEVSRPFIADLKYRGVRTSVGWFGVGLARLLRWHEVAPQLVCWVPANVANRRRRGFDQAELLANRVGGELGVPVVGLVGRVGKGSQTRRSREERLCGPALVGLGARAFGRVVVVDDVASTGASLRAAGQVVRSLGAREVTGAVAAWNR